MSSAVALQDAAEFTDLTKRASEFERAVPTNFERCTELFRGLTKLAQRWDEMSPAHRAVLSEIAAKLSEMSTRRTHVFRRTSAAFQAFWLVAKIGWEELTRQSSEFVVAKDEFIETVFAAEERTSAELRAEIDRAVGSALNDRREVKRGQVGEWLKRIPS